MLPISPKHGYRWIGRVLAWALLFGLGSWVVAAPLAVVTIVDGEAQFVRGGMKYALIEGERLMADDIIDTGPRGQLVRVEWSDGLRLSLGPTTRTILTPKPMGERGTAARVYLLQGWIKLNGDKASSVAGTTVWSPILDAIDLKGDTVMTVSSDGGEIFAESGSAAVRFDASLKLNLKSGEALRWGTDGKKPVVNARPSPPFLQRLPKAFMDTLPARAAMFEKPGKPPKRLTDFTEADLRTWLSVDQALRRTYLPERKPAVYPPHHAQAPASSASPPSTVSRQATPYSKAAASESPRQQDLGWKPLPLRPRPEDDLSPSPY
jgi:hypothetical protein